MKTSLLSRKEIIKDLETRFLRGERISVNDIVSDNFTTNSVHEHAFAKQTVRGWLFSLKFTFRNLHNKWLGAIDSEGHYGVLETEGELRHAQTRYYNLAVGIVKNARFLMKDGQTKGLLNGRAKEETLLLPVPTEQLEN